MVIDFIKSVWNRSNRYSNCAKRHSTIGTSGSSVAVAPVVNNNSRRPLVEGNQAE